MPTASRRTWLLACLAALPPLLAAVYVVLIVLNSAASLLLALVGLADSFLPLRRLPVDPHSPDSNQTKP